MKNLKRVFCAGSLVAVMALFAGCDGDTFSPEGVMKLAYDGLKKGDIHQFRSALGGAAKERFASDDEVFKVIEKMKGRKAVLSEPQVIHREPIPTTDGSVLQKRTYKVTVLEKRSGARSPFLDATIECLATRSQCAMPTVEGPNGWIPCWRTSGCKILDFAEYTYF